MKIHRSATLEQQELQARVAGLLGTVSATPDSAQLGPSTPCRNPVNAQRPRSPARSGSGGDRDRQQSTKSSAPKSAPAGLRKAIGDGLGKAAWQRCHEHFLRNALDYLPCNADDAPLQALRWIYDRWDLQEANRDLAASIGKLQGKHLKSTNTLEPLNEEIKRRTRVVRIFPNAKSCLGLIRELCVETHETRLEDSRYLNMSLLA